MKIYSCKCFYNFKLNFDLFYPFWNHTVKRRFKVIWLRMVLGTQMPKSPCYCSKLFKLLVPHHNYQIVAFWPVPLHNFMSVECLFKKLNLIIFIWLKICLFYFFILGGDGEGIKEIDLIHWQKFYASNNVKIWRYIRKTHKINIVIYFFIFI